MSRRRVGRYRTCVPRSTARGGRGTAAVLRDCRPAAGRPEGAGRSARQLLNSQHPPSAVSGLTTPFVREHHQRSRPSGDHCIAKVALPIRPESQTPPISSDADPHAGTSTGRSLAPLAHSARGSAGVLRPLPRRRRALSPVRAVPWRASRLYLRLGPGRHRVRARASDRGRQGRALESPAEHSRWELHRAFRKRQEVSAVPQNVKPRGARGHVAISRSAACSPGTDAADAVAAASPDVRVARSDGRMRSI